MEDDLLFGSQIAGLVCLPQNETRDVVQIGEGKASTKRMDLFLVSHY